MSNQFSKYTSFAHKKLIEKNKKGGVEFARRGLKRVVPKIFSIPFSPFFDP